LSKQAFAEPLTPELALVDPELARFARDQLPAQSDTLSSSRGAGSLHKDLAGAPSPPTNRNDDVARLENFVDATSGAPAEAQSEVDAGDVDRELPVPSRPRWKRRVFLAALAFVLGVGAFFAFAPDSTVREEAPNRASKKGTLRVDRHAKTRTPTRKTSTPAGVGVATVSRHSALPNSRKQTRTRSKRPSPFPTRVFIWPAVSRATFYKVEFFRRGREIFKALSPAPRLELPLRWTYRRRRFQLAPGVYSWRVSPAFGPRSRLRYGNPLIRSTWVARR
jgi:hypothetical protein